MIIEVDFNELVKTRAADGVFYVEKCPCGGFEIRAVGLVNGRILVGHRRSEVMRGAPTVDEEGLPYYDSRIHQEHVRQYDPAFLGNYQMVMAWGRVHEQLIKSVRPLALSNKQLRMLYTNFKATKLPCLVAEAEDRVKIAHYSGTEPNYKDERLVESAHETGGASLFRAWYVDYMKTKGYEKKIREAHRVIEKAFKESLTAESSSLTQKGFRLVRRTQMHQEFGRLTRIAANDIGTVRQDEESR